MIKLSWCLVLGLLLCCNAAEYSGRIIGGRPSQPADAISVTIYTIPDSDKTEIFLTTGVAISPRVVLGTAQAIRTIIEEEVVEFQKHKIGFDSIWLDDQSDAVVEQYFIHESYDPHNLQFNIAAFCLADDYIKAFVKYTFIGNIPIPNAIKVLGYGAPDDYSDFSNELLTTIGGLSTECLPLLNSLVFSETNYCIRTQFPLAQGDQGGPVTNSWLTPNNVTLFGLVSYWTRSNSSIVVFTNLRHPDIEEFISEVLDRQ